MIMSRHPNSEQNQNIRIGNKSFENVINTWGKTLTNTWGTMLTDENDIHNEIKGILNSGNVCCHTVQNLLSSRLIKNLKIKT
jgi:hypothetical protein